MYCNETIRKKYPEIYEMLHEMINEVKKTARLPEHDILDDVDLREMLKVSKRTTATWRQKGLIKHSWLMGKCYYKLSDVLEAIEQNAVKSMKDQMKIKL